MDKISDLSLDRIFWVLGNGKMPVSPEKVIIYGLLFIGIVILVNWVLSVTVVLLKPFLYAAVMLAVIRPEIARSLTTEGALMKLMETSKNFAMSISLGVMELLRLICEQFAPRLN